MKKRDLETAALSEAQRTSTISHGLGKHGDTTKGSYKFSKDDRENSREIWLALCICARRLAVSGLFTWH